MTRNYIIVRLGPTIKTLATKDRESNPTNTRETDNKRYCAGTPKS